MLKDNFSLVNFIDVIERENAFSFKSKFLFGENHAFEENDCSYQNIMQNHFFPAVYFEIDVS